jgi:hypothetical protein
LGRLVLQLTHLIHSASSRRLLFDDHDSNYISSANTQPILPSILLLPKHKYGLMIF